MDAVDDEVGGRLRAANGVPAISATPRLVPSAKRIQTIRPSPPTASAR